VLLSRLYVARGLEAVLSAFLTTERYTTPFAPASTSRAWPPEPVATGQHILVICADHDEATRCGLHGQIPEVLLEVTVEGRVAVMRTGTPDANVWTAVDEGQELIFYPTRPRDALLTGACVAVIPLICCRRRPCQ
jgi:hypothetical protein